MVQSDRKAKSTWSIDAPSAGNSANPNIKERGEQCITIA